MNKYTVEVYADRDNCAFSYVWYKENTRTLHRLEGPAVIYTDGSKQWYIEGTRYFSEQDFNKEIARRNKKDEPDPINDKVVEIEGKKYQLKLVS